MTQHVKFDEFKLEVAVAIVNKTSQECGQYTLRVGHKAGCVRIKRGALLATADATRPSTTCESSLSATGHHR
eukprot:1633104-Pleurochrysis_carterae.AAC.3